MWKGRKDGIFRENKNSDSIRRNFFYRFIIILLYVFVINLINFYFFWKIV